MDEIALVLDETKSEMEKALQHLAVEFSKIRAGKASTAMLDGLRVDYYGTPSPLAQVASITTPDARTIAIKPYERKMISEIEKAIKASDLGINPQNDGEIIRLVVPPLTEERRRNLVKQAKGDSEQSKIRLRTIRKEMNDELKKLQKGGVPEDAVKSAETKVQDFTDLYIKKVDDLLVAKEKDIMTV